MVKEFKVLVKCSTKLEIDYRTQRVSALMAEITHDVIYDERVIFSYIHMYDTHSMEPTRRTYVAYEGRRNVSGI